MTSDTHVQSMACLSCGLAGLTPADHFPQDDGLWDQPCPRCEQMMVWVTEPIPREEWEAMKNEDGDV
jgi:hypothetical protein